MPKFDTLRMKILILIGAPVALCLLISAAVLVNVIGDMTRESVETEVKSQVNAEAINIQGFFEQYGQLAKVFANDPMFMRWFTTYDERGADLSQVPDYDMINNNFIRLSSSDDNVLSAFFSSAKTYEYFRENDRTGVAKNYFANKRPWWTEALRQNKLYVGSPSADLTSGIISTVIQAPVRNAAGQLIGIGGIDLDLGQVGKRVDQLKYKNKGYAFLVDDKAAIVHFPSISGFKIINQEDDDPELAKVKPNDLITNFDAQQGTEGFSALANEFIRHTAGFTSIEFMGEKYYIAYQPTKSDYPQMNWTLGLMIPAALIEDPISSAMWQTGIIVLIVLSFISAQIMWVTRNIVKPIKRLSDAMKDVAEGDGDLTKTIDVDSNDEVGELANHFNTFISKLRRLIQQTNDHSSVVSQTSQVLSDVSTRTNEGIQQQKVQVDSVTTAVTEMAATVLEISNNAAEANTASTDAEKQTSSGYQLSSDAMKEMNNLATSMDEAVETVAGLGEESKNIGSVIDVINAIAEQTNLLALNAAIEAARAGEQGRGFAVVADEVRSLASRTQDSTKDISAMVDKLRNIAQAAESVMDKGKNQTAIGVEKTQQVQNALSAINDSIKTVQEQSSQIAVATEQQTIVAESINESLHSITDLVDSSAAHSCELSDKADHLNSAAGNLHSVVNSFKV
jgi:methyl-accepting chemotaxis protein